MSVLKSTLEVKLARPIIRIKSISRPPIPTSWPTACSCLSADDLHQRLLHHQRFIQARRYEPKVALEQQVHCANEFNLAVALHLGQGLVEHIRVERQRIEI